MGTYKQVTPDAEIVNLCTFENLDIQMWKHQMLKDMENDKKLELQSIIELPKYVAFVRKHEQLWNKRRSQFTELEKEYLVRKYHEL